MCLYELGVTAIAPLSENQFITDSQYARLKEKFKHIFLFYDNDLPGVSGANKIHKQYPDLKVVILPRDTKCKDISDYRKMYGYQKTLDLINTAKNFYLK
ncbi:MAG: toprim domain-containing protein [Methanobrevibacter sp.]|nr:toprim domain-containing protein [Methanobrevibacter sp.]